MLTPGGGGVKSEGEWTDPPGDATFIERDVGMFPEASITPLVSFYPGHVSRVMTPPTRVDARGTAAEFVDKGIVTDPRVTVKPAPYPVGVLSVVLWDSMVIVPVVTKVRCYGEDLPVNSMPDVQKSIYYTV